MPYPLVSALGRTYSWQSMISVRAIHLLSTLLIVVTLSLHGVSFAQPANARQAQAESALQSGQDALRIHGFQHARMKLDEAARLFAELGDTAQEQVALIDKAMAEYRLGDYPGAQRSLQSASRLPRRDHRLFARLEAGLGIIALELGFYRDAWMMLRRSQGGLIGDHDAYKRNIVALGRVHLAQGRYSDALRELTRARSLPGDRWDHAIVELSIGIARLDLGQIEEAQTSLEQALNLTRSTGDRITFVKVLQQLGRCHREQGDLEQALEYLEQAHSLAGNLGFNTAKLLILNDMGAVFSALEKPQDALHSYQDALAFARMTGSDTSRTLYHLGRLHQRSSEWEKAESHFADAIVVAQSRGDKPTEGLALSAWGNMLIELEDFGAAADKLYAAIAVLDSLRPGLRDLDQVSLFDKQRLIYGDLQRALVANDRQLEALVVSERGRARAFVELLAFRLEEALEKTAAELIQPLSIAQIQELARSQNATLVQYSVVQIPGRPGSPPRTNELLVWVIHPNGEIVCRSIDFQKTGFPSVRDAVQMTRENLGVRGMAFLTDPLGKPLSQVSSPGRHDFKNEGLKKLYNLLIQPVADLLPSQPDDLLIFIPHQELFLVPFAALVSPGGEYLIDQHTIATAPSLQVLDLARKSQAARPAAAGQALVVGIDRDSLIVGNPEMPRVEPFPGAEPLPLSPLPGAESEAKAIAPLLNANPLVGSEATEATVFERMPRAGLMHFATHGLFDNFNGLQSAIALTPTRENDGLLTAAEISNLELHANLVVLSACDSGRGQITGDGVIGLSRAFISAGVPSLVASLWAVPDAPTAELMTEFYIHYTSGVDKASSLRRAMMSTRQKYPRPHDWAAFVLIGDSR